MLFIEFFYAKKKRLIFSSVRDLFPGHVVFIVPFDNSYPDKNGEEMLLVQSPW